MKTDGALAPRPLSLPAPRGNLRPPSGGCLHAPRKVLRWPGLAWRREERSGDGAKSIWGWSPCSLGSPSAEGGRREERLHDGWHWKPLCYPQPIIVNSGSMLRRASVHEKRHASSLKHVSDMIYFTSTCSIPEPFYILKRQLQASQEPQEGK